MNGFAGTLIGGLLVLFGAMPSSSSYGLKSYDFSTGGGQSSSASYQENASSGNPTGTLSSASYGAYTGLTPNINANVPTAPTATNPSSYYDRLKLVINNASNPSTTKYLIAISPNSFVTTYYVQTDNSIGTGLSISNYQTYASWGGASGVIITGLTPNTTYSFKVKAIQGNFSETMYSPVSSVATVLPSLSLSLETTITSTPPYTANFASLDPGIVSTANADAVVTLSTNALSGGTVYVTGGGGLTSPSASHSISSANADLSVASSGYGAFVQSTSTVSGGPLSSVSPFNVSANSVGGLSTNMQPILTTSGAITTGIGTIRLLAKSDYDTPAATDYSDSLTLVASMSY